MGVPEKIWLFRMVHWQNVAYILKNGLSCKDHPSADSNYINIGHKKLISDRHNYPVGIAKKGTLGEYIPFYFAGHSPMLLLIKNGTGVEQRPQEDIVYIVVDFETIKAEGIPFVFTDRNAKIAFANFYSDERDFNLLDWDIIQAKYWHNTPDNFESQDLKQAEFLVHQHIPVNCISGIIVKTEERKLYFEALIAKLNLDIKIHVDNAKSYYY